MSPAERLQPPMSPAQRLQPPGTWRTVDGAAVPFAEARGEWADVAYDVLRDTAGRYNDYVTYSDLAARVQAQSGIQTRMQMRNWIGQVLVSVADRCVPDTERQLTSLCVTTVDQTVGDGYAHVLKLRGEPLPDDLQLHAAAARLECYEFYGAVIPAGGGRPTLPPKVAKLRAAAAAKRREEMPPVLCVKCNVQVPKSGRCDHCD
jgi:hypothetical protein